jgi:hypothetical protein
MKTGLQLTAAAVPFAAPDGTGSTVLVALRVRQASIEPASPPPEHVEIFTGAFDRDGQSPGWLHQTFDVSAGREPGGVLQYDTVARLDLRPGSYEIRVATGHRAAARTGSVYTYVEVPDFTKAPLSLSGVVLEDAATVPVTPADVFSAVIPLTPTAEREFAREDGVSAFVRVYQGGDGPLTPVAVRAKILDTRVGAAFDATSTLEPDRFGRARDADFRLSLPLERLAPGAYLLTVEAILGAHAARRDVRFTIR